MTPNQKPNLPALPYAAFGPELENIIETVANLTSREAPLRATYAPGAELLIEAVARITGNTYRTVKYLCSETQNVGKRPEFVLSVPPLARSLVDAVFLCVYLFEDIPQRSAQYFRGGWRELAEELQRYRQAFGVDPTWTTWLGEYEKGLEGMRLEAGVSDDEAANLKKLPYWPTPGQMLKDRSLTARSQTFLTFLDAWYYKSLSSHTHLSWPGLIMRAAALLPYQADDSLRNWRLDKQRSDAMAVTAVLALSIATEIDAALNLGQKQRLTYVWGILNGYYGHAKELWDNRYENLYDGSAA